MRHFAVLIALCFVVVAIAAPKKKHKDVKHLKATLSSVQQKKHAVAKKLQAKRREVSVVLQDVQSIESKIKGIQSRLKVTKTRLAANKAEQAKIAARLAETEQHLDAKKVVVRRRLRQMYTHDSQTGALALLAAKDLGELTIRKSVMERMAGQDRKLFQELADLRAQVFEQKKKQDRVVADTTALLVQQKSQETEFAQARKRQKAVLAELQSQQHELRRQYDQLDAESNSIANEIRAFQRANRNIGGGGSYHFTGRFIRPVNGPITSGFGSRFHPILHQQRMHTGIDFGGGTGTPIHAAASGIVVLAGRKGGYGNCVVIDHGGGISTLYGHCSHIYVSGGQRIRQGQQIAAIGSTGLATGPHLHFEIRVNGSPVNPAGRL